jgi:hypothetical protein
MQPHYIAEFFCASKLNAALVCGTLVSRTETTYLVLLQPFLEQLFASLLKNRSRKLNRLEFVQLALFEEDTEILENG